MGRYVNAVVFLAAGAGVLYYNRTHADSVLLFPGLDLLVPTLAGNPQGQGQLTGALFLGLGALFLLQAVARHLRDRREAQLDD
jgi:hypothetical protein